MLTLLALLVEIGVLYTAGRRLNGRLAGVAVSQTGPARWIVWALFAPGVALHETAHALCVLSVGGRVMRFVPFSPQVDTDTGGLRLGYVTPAYRRGTTAVARAWVGLAPLWLAPLICYVTAAGLVSGVELGERPAQVAAAAVAALPSVGAGVWLYLLVSVSLGLLPSDSDHRDLPLALLLLAPLGLLAAVGGVLGPLAALAAGPAGFLAWLLAAPAAVTCMWWLLWGRR